MRWQQDSTTSSIVDLRGSRELANTQLSVNGEDDDVFWRETPVAVGRLALYGAALRDGGDAQSVRSRQVVGNRTVCLGKRYDPEAAVRLLSGSHHLQLH